MMAADPVTGRSSCARVSHELAESSLPQLRVLVLEDEGLILMDVEDLLRGEGYRVSGAGSTRSALALMDDVVFDLAVLDVGMQTGNSRAVAAALAARNIPFIFCSGTDGPLDGFEDIPVVGKPYREGELLAALRSVQRAR